MLFDTLCVGDTVNINGTYEDDSTCAFLYYWNFGNNMTSTDCHPSFSYQTPGNYVLYYIITDQNGLRIDSLSMFYTALDCSDTTNESNRMSSDREDEQNDFSVYPNPSSGIFNIKNGNDQRYDYYVYDLTNKSIITNYNVESKLEAFDISKFAPGIYFVRIITSGGIEVFKIIKQ